MWRIPHLEPQTSLRRRLPIAALVLLVVVSPTAYSYEIPRFEDHPVPTIYHGEVKSPAFGHADQYSGTDVRCFGGDPREYAKQSVNFSGHFVISSCTCGSGCHYLFMWDAETGRLYREFPFAAIEVGPFSGEGSPGLTYKGEQYRLDSNLLVVEGCRGETCDCATRYYLWSGTRFDQILKQPVRLPPRCLTRK
jgi:hypothetical protein